MKRLLPLLLLLLASCHRKSDDQKVAQPTPSETPITASTATPTAPTPPDPNDPAEVKRRFLDVVTAAIAQAAPELKKPRTVKVATDTIAYSAEYTGHFSYDIEKSNSIVSPFTGRVSWEVLWYHDGILRNGTMTFDAMYSYQDGKWVLKSLGRNIGSTVLPAPEYLAFFQ